MAKKCMSDGGDVKADKKMIAAALKKATGKAPVKLAAGGVAKVRREFPMTKGKK